MSLVNAPLTRTDLHGQEPLGATVRAMEVGQHLIAVLLTVIGGVRAIGDGTSLPAVIISGLAILGWHAVGTIGPSRALPRRLVVGWLIGFAVIWSTAVAVSAEFVWLAFLLWLLAGHLLPLRWGLVFSALVLIVVVVAPVLHEDATTYASVFGPLIGGILLRDGTAPDVFRLAAAVATVSAIGIIGYSRRYGVRPPSAATSSPLQH